MKLLYFNCFAGISGDMTLGALVDLGVEPNFLIQELNKLPIADEFELKIYKTEKMGIAGTKVDVLIKDTADDSEHLHGHSHEHHDHEHHDHEHHDHEHHDHEHHDHEHHDHEHHDHEHHDHEHHDHEHHDHDHHDHNAVQGHGHHHRNQRNLGAVQQILEQSTLDEPIKALSLKIFMEVAKAEATVHGKPLEEVHFHEVGAVDSIVDIVGTAICIKALGVDEIRSSTVELGGGFVRCQHGLIPVPAPATAEILKNVPVHLGRVQSETTTPTGAAILKATVTQFQDATDFTILKIGCGLGTKDFPIPNILRVFLAENKPQETVGQIMVEVNIDDMNPELYDYIEGLLFEAGARDVYKTNILMKKGRPAVLLSILVDASKLEAIKTIIFNETTSLGFRTYPIQKFELDRIFEKMSTPYGEVTIKKGYLSGQLVSAKFEYEECKRIAKEYNIPIKKLYSELNHLLNP